MSAVFRRCGCRNDQGKTYGTLPVKNPTQQQQERACPTMLTDPKHGSFSWRLSRGFDQVTGKRVVVNGGTFPTLKAAQTALNSARVKKDQGALHKPTQQTLAEYAPQWLERRQTTGQRPLAPTTANHYRRYIELDIAPSFMGKKKLTDIRRVDVVAFVDALTKSGRGATTVARILATVQSILTGAVKDELIPFNVARGIDTATITHVEKPIWTPEQLGYFLELAADEWLAPLFEFALHTALRRGEVCGLRWTDVDVNRRVATIRHNRVLVNAEVIETIPKTKASAAEVELSGSAIAALEGWRLRQDLERQEWGAAWQGDGHVFTYEDGRPLDPSYVTKRFGTLVRKTERALQKRQRQQLADAGMSTDEIEQTMSTSPVTLPQLTLHGLRHVAASYMWDSTGDLLAVSKALRHSSPAVTAAVYAHMRAGKQRELFGTIAEQLSSTGVHTLHTQTASGA